MSHYDTLGVNKDATQDEIKKAYRKLASKHHPDKGGDTVKFQEIQTAYDVLSDEAKRQMYDSGQNGGHQHNWNSQNLNQHDLNEIFKNFGFGFDPFMHHGHNRRNKDLKVHLSIPLESTLAAQTKTISVQTTSGHRETVEVEIPRGIANDTNIKYPNLGDNLFNTLPRGDLYVSINVAPHAEFTINNLDLYRRYNVNSLLAITGGDFSVVGLDGTTFKLTLPAGTQNGTKFRIPQHGLYQLRSETRGDFYIEAILSTPKNLTPDQIEIIRSITNQ
jgi:DnaJ-class molecular chaperone